MRIVHGPDCPRTNELCLDVGTGVREADHNALILKAAVCYPQQQQRRKGRHPTLLATAAYEAVHGAGGSGGRTEAVAGAAGGAGAIYLATRSTTAALAAAAAELATWYLLSERLGITTWCGLQGTSAKIMKSE